MEATVVVPVVVTMITSVNQKMVKHTIIVMRIVMPIIMEEVIMEEVEVILEVVAQIHAQEDGRDRMVVNILNERVIPHKGRFGPVQNAHAPLGKSALKGIVEIRMKKTVYHQEALHGTITNSGVYARVNT